MLALRTSVTAVALLVVGKPATSLLETNGSFSPVYELRRPGFKLTLFFLLSLPVIGVLFPSYIGTKVLSKLLLVYYSY